MTEPTDETTPVFRLIYRSQSRIDADARVEELGEIFTASRRGNQARGITGALVISGDAFVQVLEGGEALVRELYAKIGQDPRHEQLSVLDEQPDAERVFGRWAMARVSEDGSADLRLMSNAQRGRIVAVRSADRVTDAQEEILASMRASLALDMTGS